MSFSSSYAYKLKFLALSYCARFGCGVSTRFTVLLLDRTRLGFLHHATVSPRKHYIYELSQPETSFGAINRPALRGPV